MGLHVWKDERDKPNIELLHGDRRNSNVLYGKRIDDPKIKVVKVGIAIPRPQNYMRVQQGKKVIEHEANSPVLNFYRRLIGQLGGVAGNIDTNFELRKQDNTLYTGNYIIQFGLAADTLNIETTVGYGYCTDADIDTYGIALGTGDTAWTEDDYAPEILIQQGTTAGKLVYSPTPTPITSYAGGVWTVLGRRVFDNFNADANTITVKEVVQFVPEWIGTYQFSYIDERTVLNTPLAIPYKSGAVFTYTRTLTIPAITTLLPNGVNFLLQNAFGINLYQIGGTYGTGSKNVKTVTGSVLQSGSHSPNRYNQTGNYYCPATASVTNRGCCAGYGDTAVADTDYELESLYAHGNDENELAYKAQDTPIGVYDSPSKTFTVTQSKVVTNNWSSQVIREIGLKHYRYANNIAQSGFLINRTVLGSPITLAPYESLAIIYELSMTHP